MTDFNAMMQQDAQNMFLKEFAEDVVYTPLYPHALNPVRTIKAIVLRDPPAPAKANPNYTPPKMMVQVANDPLAGVDSSKMDTGGDTITVAYRIGTPAKPFRIHLPPADEMHDIAMLKLELR